MHPCSFLCCRLFTFSGFFVAWVSAFASVFLNFCFYSICFFVSSICSAICCRTRQYSFWSQVAFNCKNVWQRSMELPDWRFRAAESKHCSYRGSENFPAVILTLEAAYQTCKRCSQPDRWRTCNCLASSMYPVHLEVSLSRIEKTMSFHSLRQGLPWLYCLGWPISVQSWWFSWKETKGRRIGSFTCFWSFTVTTELLHVLARKSQIPTQAAAVCSSFIWLSISCTFHARFICLYNGWNLWSSTNLRKYVTHQVTNLLNLLELGAKTSLCY